MEAVAALGLVCNILQVAQYTYQIAAKGNEIRTNASGLTLEHHELADCTTELIARNERLRAHLTRDKSQASVDQVDVADATALRAMGESCNAAATDLVNELRRIGTSSTMSRFKSYRQALKSVWSREKIDSLAMRMKLYQDQINSQVLVSLSRQQSVLSLKQSNNFAQLDQTGRKMLENIQQLSVLTADHIDMSTDFLARLIKAENTRLLEQLTLVDHPYVEVPHNADLLAGKRAAETDSKREQTIHEAARARDLKGIQTVLRKDPAAVKSLDDSARTALHIVAELGDSIAIAYLLRKGAEINAEDDEFATSLHYAVRSGDAKSIRLLLSKGADPDALDISAQQPRTYAPKQDDEINWIFDVGHGLEDKDSNGNTALLHFVLQSSTAVVDSLLAQGANAKIRSRHGQSAIWLATNVHMGAPQEKFDAAVHMIKSLLKHGADPSACNKDDRADSPCSTASLNGFYDAVILLIEAGADLNTQNSYRFTALHEACDHGHEDIAVALIQKGADVLIKNCFDYEPLHYACMKGEVSVCRALADRDDFDVNRLGRDGWTPIAEASHHGHASVVQMLLDCGADAEIVTSPQHGAYPPICLAAMNGCFDTIDILLRKAKVNVNGRGRQNWTALHEASSRGFTETVCLLLQHGADPTLINLDEEYTPLAKAAYDGHNDTITALVRNGHALLDARTERNRDVPLTIAVKRRHTATVTLLLSLGASTENSWQDQNEKPPPTLLMHAIRNDDMATARVLIAHGENTDAQDGNGNTPLILAAMLGRISFVQFLLEVRADQTVRNKKLLNAVDYAGALKPAQVRKETLALFEEYKL